MQNSWIRLVLILVLSIQWSACSTSTALISYENIDSTIKVSDHEVQGTNVGAVRGDSGGALWANCTEKASDSVREMIIQAKAKGANAIGNLRWYASGNSTPSCKKEWGYALLWPLLLTPLFMSTAVEGTAYKAHGNAATGLYLIPESVEAQFALARQIATAQ